MSFQSTNKDNEVSLMLNGKPFDADKPTHNGDDLAVKPIVLDTETEPLGAGGEGNKPSLDDTTDVSNADSEVKPPTGKMIHQLYNYLLWTQIMIWNTSLVVTTVDTYIKQFICKSVQLCIYIPFFIFCGGKTASCPTFEKNMF